jgi:acetolactate synthase-1/3 small subunit
MDPNPIRPHIISVLVENQFGVLARIAGLFSGKGYNIDSLCVAETDDPTISRMTIVVSATEQTMEQVIKQLNRLVDVIKVQDLTDNEYVERELALIKVEAEGIHRSEIIQIVDIFRARIVDVNPAALTIEVTGDQSKIVAIINMLSPYKIREIVRTGKIAIQRGAK